MADDPSAGIGINLGSRQESRASNHGSRRGLGFERVRNLESRRRLGSDLVRNLESRGRLGSDLVRNLDSRSRMGSGLDRNLESRRGVGSNVRYLESRRGIGSEIVSNEGSTASMVISNRPLLSLPSVRRYSRGELERDKDRPEEVRLSDGSYNGPALG